MFVLSLGKRDNRFTTHVSPIVIEVEMVNDSVE
jgi:hypothetical protein